MLKGLHPLLTPELLHVMAEMGHGDRLGIVDANFPSRSSVARVVWLPGADTRAAATAVLSLFPVDTADHPAAFRIVPADEVNARIPSHGEFQDVVDAAEGRHVDVEPLPRRDFYAAARECRVLVQTGEPRPYSCFIVVKGTL